MDVILMMSPEVSISPNRPRSPIMRLPNHAGKKRAASSESVMRVHVKRLLLLYRGDAVRTGVRFHDAQCCAGLGPSCIVAHCVGCRRRRSATGVISILWDNTTSSRAAAPVTAYFTCLRTLRSLRAKGSVPTPGNCIGGTEPSGPFPRFPWFLEAAQFSWPLSSSSTDAFLLI